MKYVFLILVAVAPLVRPISLEAQEPTRASNVFNLNGETVELSSELLQELRQRWDGREAVIVTSVLLNKDDVRWIMDYISIMEISYSPGCEELTLVTTRKFDRSELQSTQVDIAPGLFDYAWEVDACGNKHTYRIVNIEGESDFTVYPSLL